VKIYTFAAGALSALLLAGAGSAHVLYQTGFEQPEYSAGAIAGQNGWQWDGVVQGDTVYSGRQALEIDAQSSELFLSANLDLALPTAGKILDFKYAFLETGTGGAQTGLGIRGNTGFVAQLAGGAGSFWLGNTNHASARIFFGLNVWHQVDFRLNFLSGTMTGFVDGVSLGQLSINGAVPNTLTLVVLNSYSSGTAVPQKVYFDNFSISGVPEPASWAMMVGGFGLVGGAMRARRKAMLSFA